MNNAKQLSVSSATGVIVVIVIIAVAGTSALIILGRDSTSESSSTLHSTYPTTSCSSNASGVTQCPTSNMGASGKTITTYDSCDPTFCGSVYGFILREDENMSGYELIFYNQNATV